MEQKPKYYRGLFLSSWLPLVYDFWVWLAVCGNTKKLRENILEFVPQNPNVLIDLATGTGENALLLKREFPLSRVLASDLSYGMLKVAQKKALRKGLEIEFSLKDATKTNYPSEIANFVAISFALHDLPGEKREEVIKEAHRLLKQGGVFVIYDYHLPKNLFVRIPLIIQFLLVENLDAWRMLKENLTEKLKEAGFRNTKKKTYYKGLAQIVIGER